jgi:hypothetical protein
MMNRLKDYVRFIHGFQVYRPSHVDSERKIGSQGSDPGPVWLGVLGSVVRAPA